MLAIGTLLTLVALVFLSADNRLTQSGLHAQGVVVGHESRNRGSSAAVVEFTDRDGTVRTFDAENVSASAGEQVEVIYDPAAPQFAAVDSFSGRMLMPLGFLVFGLVIGGLGLWTIVAVRRRSGAATDA
jgi:hypothetical protein